MAEEHLSIGEVLTELADEYPDVTISKIRFLESQGLIDPERTPSGYRKFYPGDVERLRWILHQQKENFLPLKVIRERMAELDGDVGADLAAAHAAGGDGAEASDESATSSSSRKTSKKSGAKKSGAKKGAAKKSAAKKRSAGASKQGGRRSLSASSAPMLPLDEVGAEPVTRSAPVTGATFTRDELARAAGVDNDALGQLESYGIIVPVAQGERVLFDEEALLVARTAAGFAKHGIEARHLKMYLNFAGREAGMFEQVLLPHLRQRNPEAKSKAQTELEELAKLGATMRVAMLRRTIARSLSG